ncbi:putative D,D-dipeptide transport ATP-binding protein DdpD [compost metagenome]
MTTMRDTTKNQPLLDVKGLRVAFGGKPVVHGIDLQIAAGEKLALVGESGSGKTVTALSLLRLVQNADLDGVATLSGSQAQRGAAHATCCRFRSANCAASAARRSR